MPRKDPFLAKVLNRIVRLDRNALETHLREAADRIELYESILKEINEAVVLIDSSGTVLWMNASAKGILGTAAPESRKCDIDRAIADPQLVRFIKQHLPKLSSRKVEDFNLIAPRERMIRAALMPVEDRKNLALMILTELPADQTRAIWDERLARIESLVHLAAGIAHEIGNPLNSIAIHLQLLKKETDSLPGAKKEGIQKTLATLISETNRLDRIIRNFLSATRKQPLRFRPDDLNQILREALEFMKPELRASGIQSRLKEDSSLPHFLMDRDRLYPAFINLIKNALEAMPDGGELHLSVSYKDHMAVIRIRDTGKGIDESDLPHIFDTYFTTKKEGSGLGLMTVFNAVKDHGGRIEAESKPKRGTTLTLLLPIRSPNLQLPSYQDS